VSPAKLYSPKELAREIGRPLSFVRQAVRSGLLRYQQAVEGGNIYIKLEDWAEYVEAITVRPDPSQANALGQRRGPRRRPASYKMSLS
jgi:DNA-directed RNA polymerase specialized sigma24 family protein